MALANFATAHQTSARRAEDSRADQGLRWVTVARDLVQIERTVSGMKMRIHVPMEAYVGVTLRPVTSGNTTTYDVKLVHRDAELSVLLESLNDEAAAKALWLQWADYLGRTALDNGMTSQAVADTLRPQQPRRRCMTAVDKRRPRRALRRKPGNRENLGIIRGSEDEIISYE